MVRAPSIDKNGIRKGEWSKEEDDKLKAYINRYGIWNWRQLPKYAGMYRNFELFKPCRELTVLYMILVFRSDPV